jgi:lipopolysaccharide export LptBFGC system permease protein LptF
MTTPGDQLYRAVIWIFSVVIMGFGVAILILTLARGASIGSAGIWIGLLFLAVGVARLYIALRTRN